MRSRVGGSSYSPPTPLWGRYSLASVTMSNDGAFEIGPMRGGEYLVVALDPAMTPPRLEDRDEAARLAKVAERVSLRDEDHQTIELHTIKRH
jgi:hypothetical protein